MAKKYKYCKVVKEMKQNHETQVDVGKLLGMTDYTLRSKLSGTTQWTIGDIETLCKHYKKDYYELFSEE